jgi:hypothetical protein
MSDLINIQDILEKEVSRRDFLIQVGAATAALVGVSALLKKMLNFSQPNIATPQPSLKAVGYGVSSYSGIPKLKRAPES